MGRCRMLIFASGLAALAVALSLDTAAFAAERHPMFKLEKGAHPQRRPSDPLLPKYNANSNSMKFKRDNMGLAKLQAQQEKQKLNKAKLRKKN